MSDKRRSNECHGHVRPSVSDCGYDWLDVLALEQLRWLCISYGHKTHMGWEMAIARSEATLGEANGPLFFTAVSAVLKSIRCGRRSPIEYSDPTCPVCSRRVMDHERAIMSVVRAARRSDNAALDSHAFLMLEGHDPSRLISAALRLAAVMERIDSEQQAVNGAWRRPEPRPLPDAVDRQHRDA